MIPALRAIYDQVPQCSLHVLVREETAPLFQNLPWLKRVWTVPRSPGRARFADSWPVIRALRRERFQYSIAFAGNDRTAILTFLCGAKNRLGLRTPDGFFGKRLCFTETCSAAPLTQNEALRWFTLLKCWGIQVPPELTIGLQTNPESDRTAAEILPTPKILCNLTSRGANKEWPISHWSALAGLAESARLPLVFSAGPSAREQQLLLEFSRQTPKAAVLGRIPDLGLFLSVIKRASLVISGDSGPVHFAAGLGVPVIVLYGPTAPPNRWAPLGKFLPFLPETACTCPGAAQICSSSSHCLASISPEKVLQGAQSMLALSPQQQAY